MLRRIQRGSYWCQLTPKLQREKKRQSDLKRRKNKAFRLACSTSGGHKPEGRWQRPQGWERYCVARGRP